MEIITTTMGMVETMGVPTRYFRHAALRIMTKREKVRYAASSFVNKALTWWNTQIQARGREAAIGANHAAYTDRFHELAKLVPHLVTPESARIKRYVAGLAPEIRGMLKVTQPTTIQNAILRAGILNDEAIRCGTLSKSNEKRKAMEETGKSGGLCFNCQRPGYFAKDCQAPFKRATPMNAVRMGHNRKACYECGSPDHLQYNCPKLYRAPGQAGNPLALEGNRNTQNNGKGLQCECECANFSIISTEFAPLLNVEPSIVNPGYVIEVADGKKIENKVVIVCHEKVVEIPLEGSEILRVQEERTLGVAKALMNAKVDEPKVSDISMVRDFVDVFPEDLSGLPPQR
ncbi:putative reverse transcriptase domain-containing protein [Tanacetum coccineum]